MKLSIRKPSELLDFELMNICHRFNEDFEKISFVHGYSKKPKAQKKLLKRYNNLGLYHKCLLKFIDKKNVSEKFFPSELRLGLNKYYYP
ncbi:MAG: hypothetical protein ABH811_02610 [archaeon]